MKALACVNITVGCLCFYTVLASLHLPDLGGFWNDVLITAIMATGTANIAWGAIKLGG